MRLCWLFLNPQVMEQPDIAVIPLEIDILIQSFVDDRATVPLLALSQIVQFPHPVGFGS